MIDDIIKLENEQHEKCLRYTEAAKVFIGMLNSGDEFMDNIYHNLAWEFKVMAYKAHERANFFRQQDEKLRSWLKD